MALISDTLTSIHEAICPAQEAMRRSPGGSARDQVTILPSAGTFRCPRKKFFKRAKPLKLQLNEEHSGERSAQKPRKRTARSHCQNTYGATLRNTSHASLSENLPARTLPVDVTLMIVKCGSGDCRFGSRRLHRLFSYVCLQAVQR